MAVETAWYDEYAGEMIAAAAAIVAAFAGFVGSAIVEGARRGWQRNDAQRAVFEEYLANLAEMVRTREDAYAINVDLADAESRLEAIQRRVAYGEAVAPDELDYLAVSVRRLRARRAETEAAMAAQHRAFTPLHFKLNLHVAGDVTRVAARVPKALSEVDAALTPDEGDSQLVKDAIATLRARVTDVVVMARSATRAPGSRGVRTMAKRISRGLGE